MKNLKKLSRAALNNFVGGGPGDEDEFTDAAPVSNVTFVM